MNVTYLNHNTGVGRVTGVYRDVPDGLDYDGVVEGDDISHPSPMGPGGFSNLLLINLETKEMYYDYISQETLESRTQQLQRENEDLRTAIMELTMVMAGPPVG